MEEREKTEEEEEAEEWKEDEVYVEEWEDYDILMESLDSLAYCRSRVAGEDGGESEGIVVMLDSYLGDRAGVEDHEEKFESFDMSEENIYHSGPLKRIY